MAELVDALVSGTSVRKDVQVRVLFWVQTRFNDSRFFGILESGIIKYKISPGGGIGRHATLRG